MSTSSTAGSDTSLKSGFYSIDPLTREWTRHGVGLNESSEALAESVANRSQHSINRSRQRLSDFVNKAVSSRRFRFTGFGGSNKSSSTRSNTSHDSKEQVLIRRSDDGDTDEEISRPVLGRWRRTSQPHEEERKVSRLKGLFQRRRDPFRKKHFENPSEPLKDNGYLKVPVKPLLRSPPPSLYGTREEALDQQVGQPGNVLASDQDKYMEEMRAFNFFDTGLP